MVETILSEEAYKFISLLTTLGIIIGLSMLIANLLVSKIVLEDGHTYVKMKELKSSPEGKLLYRKRIKMIVISSLIILTGLAIITAGKVTGETKAHTEIEKERILTEIREQATEINLNLSSEQYEALFNEKRIPVEITLPNGIKEEATVFYKFRVSCLCAALIGEDIDGFSADIKRRNDPLVNKMISQEFEDLENKYGIHFTTAQRIKLNPPTIKPETLTTYGTTTLTIPESDSTYYSGPVTLIWDDGLKLIISSNPDGTFKELAIDPSHKNKITSKEESN